MLWCCMVIVSRCSKQGLHSTFFLREDNILWYVCGLLVVLPVEFCSEGVERGRGLGKILSENDRPRGWLVFLPLFGGRMFVIVCGL